VAPCRFQRIIFYGEAVFAEVVVTLLISALLRDHKD
jgi:hypothetical protein